MRTFVLLAITLSSIVASAQNNADQNVALKSMREMYNGTFINDVDGSARAAIADGKLVIELAGDIAKSLLYNIPEAKEQIQWIPADKGSSWSNYFVRTGSSIRCGHYSKDLLADPFPRLRCRLTVDSDGAVKAFGDRATGKSESHNSKYLDMFYGDLGGTTGPSGTYDFMKNKSPAQVHLQVFGQPALDLFNQMTNVPETDDNMGPIKTKMKRARQIWCAKMSSPDGFSDDPAKSVKCRIALNSKGNAIKDQ